MNEGSHKRLFDVLGAHAIEHEGYPGMHFAVWGAQCQARWPWSATSTTGTGRRHGMRRRLDTGVWEIFLPNIGPGRAYKYEITAADGHKLPQKADPLAYRSEMRPATASVTPAPLRPHLGRPGPPRFLGIGRCTAPADQHL